MKAEEKIMVVRLRTTGLDVLQWERVQPHLEPAFGYFSM